MAEVKNAFLKARMNKDVDDRLIPSGEYRHAVNAQVTTAESSDAGTLQNVLGNTIEHSFTVAADASCIGFFVDESSDFVYVFITDNNTEDTNAYNPSGVGSNHYIYKYDVYKKEAFLLAEGAFLNFHKSFEITGVNLLEELLFWTDNRNQPRKINVTKSSADYTIEDNISVAKYNPYKSIEVYKESELSPGDYETTMKDVTSLHLPNGGTGNVSGATEDLSFFSVENVVVPSYPMTLTSGMTIHVLDSSNKLKPLTDSNGDEQVAIVQNVIHLAGNPLDKLAVTIGANVSLNEGDVLVFNANPYLIEDYPGDTRLNEDKFIRFSYRFKFDDGEYSIQAPFTQICFIPQQDGYFMSQTSVAGDELEAIESTIVDFMQNKVNEIKLQIPLPVAGNLLSSALHIAEIDVLYTESTSSNIKVIETISVEDLTDNTSEVYEYLYQSKKPYRTLPSKDTTRVYDKIPVKALSQEIISNRVVYANFQDKHTPPKALDYHVASTPKAAFQIGVGSGQVPSSGGQTSGGSVIPVVSVEGDIEVGYKVTGADIDGFLLITALNTTGVDSYSVTLNTDVTLPAGSQLEFRTISSDTNTTSSVEYPSSSLKTNRSYQVGVVLSDKFGRQSTVILSNNKDIVIVDGQPYSSSTFYSPYVDREIEPSGWFGNSLKMRFSEKIGPSSKNQFTYEPGLYNGDPSSPEYNPLGWYSYKVVVKQTEQEYYNVYTSGAIKGLPYNYDHTYSSSFDPAPVVRPSTSYIALTNDNINKIPRDLSKVGPRDNKFRSSVRLFGRVQNNEIENFGLIQTNEQYYPGERSFTSVGVESLFDGFEVSNFTGGGTDTIPITNKQNPFSSFYRSDSNPFIAEISTSKQLEEQFGVPAFYNASGFAGIKKLAVFETAPTESLLDIFWETSTAGLIQDLNDLIDASGETGGAKDITDWDTQPYVESIRNTQGGNFILQNYFTVKNSFGENVDPTLIDSITISSVTDGLGVDRSNYFEIEEDLPNNPKFYNIKTTEAHEENVYYDSPTGSRIFHFNLSVQLIGEPYSETIIKTAALANEEPTLYSLESLDNNQTIQLSPDNNIGSKTHITGFNGSGSFTDRHPYNLDELGLVWTIASAVNSSGASASDQNGLPYFSVGTFDRDQQQQGDAQDPGNECYLYQEINSVPAGTYTIKVQAQDAGGAGLTSQIDVILDYYPDSVVLRAELGDTNFTDSIAPFSATLNFNPANTTGSLVIQRVNFTPAFILGNVMSTITPVGSPINKTVANLSQGINYFDIDVSNQPSGSDYYLITLTVDSINSNSKPPESVDSIIWGPGAPFAIR